MVNIFPFITINHDGSIGDRLTDSYRSNKAKIFYLSY